jgi:hypothetical protein
MMPRRTRNTVPGATFGATSLSAMRIPCGIRLEWPVRAASLDAVSLLRRKPPVDDASASEAVVAEPIETVGKGRPTPKRREAEGKRGPVAPPPMTQREAAKRRNSGPPGKVLTKDEKRVQAAERRERMMRGEDAYLLPRDRGAVRAYVRDMVDARRNIAGLLLPLAVLSFLVLLVPIPVITVYGPLVLMVAILAAVVDSVIFGRQLSRKIATKFPNGDKSGQSTRGSSLGFYAFNRACLIRKWRVPRPRVERGAVIN